jgi:outer membrane receptor protein involved in Fe transport
MRWLARPFLVIIPLLWPAFGLAQDPPRPEATPPASTPAGPSEIPVLPPVVVSATRTERSLADLPVSATVITREEIMNSPGRFIEESLRAVAGVQLPGDSADFIFPLVPSIAIRGVGVGDTADRVLVLVNGIPINGGFFGNVFWNRVPKDIVERIEVVRGASSSLYGSYAMGGVINIVTRAPSERAAVLDASYGQQNSIGSNLWLSDAFADKKFSLGFNGNFYQTDGYVRHIDPPPVEGKQSARLFNLQGHANFTLSPSVKGFLRAGYNNQTLDGGFQHQNADSAIVDVAGGLDIDAGSVGTFTLRGFYAHEDFRVDNVEVPEPTVSFVSNAHDTKSHDFGFSGQWSKALGLLGSSVTAGVDFRRIHGKDDQDVFNEPGVLASTIVGQGTQTSVGIFGELSVRPLPKLEILGNLRFDYFLNSDGKIVTDGVTQRFSNRDFTILSPRIAGRYQLVEPLAVRAAYYQGFRVPTLAELYRSFESPTFRGLSNPNLKEERVQGGDAGLEYRVWRLSGQLNGFINEVKDFVGSAEVPSPDDKFTVQASNVAKTRAYGMEFIANAQITRDLSLTVNYTLMNATVIKGPLTGNKVEGAPTNVAGISLNYIAPFGLTVNGRARYVGDSFQDISNEAPQDAHWVFDLYASYQIWKHLQVFFGITNIFDEKYVSDGFGRDLGAPRRVYGGLRAMF